MVLIAIFSPRALAGLSASIWELGILGGLGYGVYRVVKWLAGADHSPPSSLPPVEQVRPARRDVRVNYVPPPPRPVPRVRPVPLQPEDPRPLTKTRRLTEFSGSAAVAGLLSAAVAGVLAATGAVESFAGAVLFGAVTALASWAALGAVEGVRGD